MRKSVLCLAVTLLFSLGMLAQGTSTSSSSSDQSSTQTTTKSKKAANREGKVKTEHQVTGCLSGPDAEGAYKLTNGHYKKGLEVGGNDELKNHVGHEVTLVGTWAKGSDIGENEKAESKTEKTEEAVGMHKHFQVSEIKMKSETCTAMATGKTKKSKKSASSSPTT
jgi:hypothetical protein